MFVLFIGVESDVKKRYVVELYNVGKCLVLFILGVGVEGLDLKYMFYVYVMESFWNESMIQ